MKIISYTDKRKLRISIITLSKLICFMFLCLREKKKKKLKIRNAKYDTESSKLYIILSKK